MTAPAADWRPLFPSMARGDAESQLLMDRAQLVTLGAGEVVFHAGSACRSYVLLLEGTVRVQLIGEGGREALLYRVQPGQSCILTTCCVLSNEDYPAQGCTEAPVRALAIAKPAFDRALECAPAFRRFVFDNLGGRVAQVIVRMEELAFRPVERRLVGYLLSKTSGGERLSATHQEIAAELGTAREVVSRHLKRFEVAGLVRLGRATVEVSDRTGLERLRAL